MRKATQVKVVINALFYALLLASLLHRLGIVAAIKEVGEKELVMSVPAIQTALQQMQTMKAEVAAPAAAKVNLNVQPGVEQTQNGGFAGELKNSIERINSLQQTAAATTTAFQLGDPNVSLNQVMVDKQKAGLAFEMGVQVRNKLVSAYKDIMNMQV